MKKTFIRRLAAFAVMLSYLFGSIHPDELIVALASEYVGECEYCGGAVWEEYECDCGYDGLHHGDGFGCYKNYHCPECGRGCGEEQGILVNGEDGWCPIGGQGSHCIGCATEDDPYFICDFCGDEHCTLCFGGSWDEWGCETCYRCVNCWNHCTVCGVCNEAADYCEYCEMCVDCAMDEGLHCPECGSCYSDNEACPNCGYCENCCEEWHCPNCGDCYYMNEDAICEICGCCPNDSEYDHCEECERCFEEADKCEWCGLCVECCEAAAYDAGCDCLDHVCVNDPEFTDHMKAEHPADSSHTAKPKSSWSFDKNYHWHDCIQCSSASHITGKAAHSYNANGVCKFCGAISGSTVAVIKQPRNVHVKVSSEDDAYDKNARWSYYNNQAVFTVTAKSTYSNKLTYQWEVTTSGGDSVWGASILANDQKLGAVSGLYTDTFTMYVPSDACVGNLGSIMCGVRCRISDGRSTIYTDWARMYVGHNLAFVSDGANGHHSECIGYCEYKSKTEGHSFGAWSEVSDGTLSASCKQCGYTKTIKPHEHYADFGKFFERPIEDYDIIKEDDSSGEYEYRLKSNPNYRFAVTGTYHAAPCGEENCEHIVMSHHNWKLYNTDASNYPSPMNDISVNVTHKCTECDYVKEDDTPWKLGSHLILCGENVEADKLVAAAGEKVQLFHYKVPGKKFSSYNLFIDKYVTKSVGSKVGSYSTEKIDLTKYRYFNSGTEVLTINPSSRDAGKYYITAVYTACDHSEGTEVRDKKDATCTQFGYTGDTVCTECGEVLTAGKDIKPTGHGELYAADKNVYRTDKSGKVVYKDGQPVYNVRVKSTGTCVAPGYSGDVYCSYCDSIVEYGHVIPAKGHRWMSPVTTLAPTATTEGKASVVCASCGMKKIVTLPKSLTSTSFDMQLPTTPDGYKTPPVITGVDSNKISVFFMNYYSEETPSVQSVVKSDFEYDKTYYATVRLNLNNNNTLAGNFRANINGGQYKVSNALLFNTISVPFRLTKRSIKDADISCAYTSFTYTGKQIDVAKYVTVKYDGKTLVNGTDYELSYENGVDVGYQTCTLTVSGIGEYKDSVSKKLTIKPPKLAAPTLSTKNSAIIVKWKKVTTYAVGYQIIYDKVESFDTSSANHTEDYHTTTVTDLNTLTKTLSAYTKPGETWYVKYHPYITIDGTKYYGNYSAVKTVKTK